MKLRIGIIMARNLKTSTSPNGTTLNIVNHLNAKKYRIDIYLLDHLIPPHLRLTKSKMKKDPMYISFDRVLQTGKVSNVHHLDELTLSELKKKMDVAIVAIYNFFGEDGRVLGLLETIGVPYIAPNLLTSALCFDKGQTKAVLRQAGVTVPDGFAVQKKNSNIAAIHRKIVKNIGYPCMIKANMAGASRGISLVDKPQNLSSAIEKAFIYSDELLVEAFIDGREFSVGVMGDYTNPIVLPIVEIKTKRAFFDYTAKYVKGESEEICPAQVTPKMARAVRQAAQNVYVAVKADSHARVDIIWRKGTPYVLEINTFPGLTSASIFPKELEAMGTTLDAFFDLRIQAVRKKNATINLPRAGFG